MKREKLREMAVVVAEAGGLEPERAGGLEEILVLCVRDALEEAARLVVSRTQGDITVRADLADEIRALKPEIEPPQESGPPR